jgi:O-antigen ligase
MPNPAKSFGLDRKVVDHQLAPGTFRRILGFARPYRATIATFLAIIVLDALVAAATPLLYREIIDRGIVQGRRGLVIALAAIVAGLAVVLVLLAVAILVIRRRRRGRIVAAVGASAAVADPAGGPPYATLADQSGGRLDDPPSTESPPTGTPAADPEPGGERPASPPTDTGDAS